MCPEYSVTYLSGRTRSALARASQQPRQDDGIEGLGGMLIETGLVRQLAIRIAAEPGHRNQEWMVQLRPLSQLPRHLVPVHVGHGDVQKDDLRKKRSDDLFAPHVRLA